MSIFAADCKLINGRRTIERKENTNNVFSLQFTEIFTESKKQGVTSEILLQSFVELVKIPEVGSYTLEPNVRLRTLRFYFTIEQLSELLNQQIIEGFFNEELLNRFTEDKSDIIDVVYKPILDELMVAELNQPLKINFIQNRILLLLEKFMYKQQKVQEISLKQRLNNNELERLIQVEALLIKDFSVTAPTIEKLAKLCAMSATKFKNEFKTLYGAPVYEYYQKNRMSKAKALLLEGGHTSKEVGSLIGYSNLSHFAAAFKKEFGISPSDLLAKHLNQSN